MSVGYLIEVEKSARMQPDEAPLAAPAVGAWFRSLLLRAHANRLLRRTLRRPERIHLDEMPAYLKRDLGLPPDLM
ncbi:hypothetical protein [Devosia sp. CN2-171]|jgi:hypothetical protein|uniref:hypothetical protein n=1 Tax=Devosia sp. CN2-171 TaxID=3400909 RepID=UPI003BF7E152